MNIISMEALTTLHNTYITIIVMVFVYLCISIVKYLKDKNSIKMYEVNMNCSITRDDVLAELDDFIKSKWDEYFIFNLGWKDKKFVLNSKEQEKIIHDLGTDIAKSISPLLVEKLSRFYNPQPDENGVSAIDTLIAFKIHMLVLNYELSE